MTRQGARRPSPETVVATIDHITLQRQQLLSFSMSYYVGQHAEPALKGDDAMVMWTTEREIILKFRELGQKLQQMLQAWQWT